MTDMENLENRAANSTLTGDDEIICGCLDLTVGQIKVELSTDTSDGFDGFLARTGAGKSCTACLLDLEYLYTSLPRVGDMSKVKKLAGNQAAPKLSLKRRIYKILDGLSPMVPYPLEGVAPILIGADIEQRLTVANHSLLFEGEVASPDTIYSVAVYDGEGKFKGRLKNKVEQGKSWRANLSDMFTQEERANESLAVGLMKIKWRFGASGKRGTTRPQIEINARSGSCAVHTQRTGSALEKWVTLIWQPADQRLFLTIVNPSSSRLEGQLRYPILNDDSAGITPQSQQFSVPANGATLQEIILTGDTADQLINQPIGIHAAMSHPNYKMHVLCAAADLGRFSIDHL